MRKKLWAAMLALAVLLGLTAASALADVMENIQVSDIKYYSSGCLEGFTMTYTVGPGLAAADVRVSVQTGKFSERVSGYPYGDFRDNGRYARNHRYPTWPDVPADCGFIAWNGDTFRRPASGGSDGEPDGGSDGRADTGPDGDACGEANQHAQDGRPFLSGPLGDAGAALGMQHARACPQGKEGQITNNRQRSSAAVRDGERQGAFFFAEGAEEVRQNAKTKINNA